MAIVKVQASWKRVGPRDWRAVCGAATCPGSLAIVTLFPNGDYLVRAGLAHGCLVKDGEGRYRIRPAGPSHRSYRRPRFLGRADGLGPDGRPIAWALGRTPTIPCVIVCRVCGRENAIDMAPPEQIGSPATT